MTKLTWSTKWSKITGRADKILCKEIIYKVNFLLTGIYMVHQMVQNNLSFKHNQPKMYFHRPKLNLKDNLFFHFDHHNSNYFHKFYQQIPHHQFLIDLFFFISGYTQTIIYIKTAYIYIKTAYIHTL